MSIFHRCNPCDETEQALLVEGLTRREIIKRGVMAAASAAMFGSGVQNLEARSSLSSAQPLKPGTKLSALRGVETSNEFILRRNPAERFVVVSSRNLDPAIAKALGNSLMTMAMLRKIDPGGKQEPPFETIIGQFGWGGICVIPHHMGPQEPPGPPWLASIEASPLEGKGPE